jgi:hypothetical protein
MARPSQFPLRQAKLAEERLTVAEFFIEPAKGSLPPKPLRSGRRSSRQSRGSRQTLVGRRPPTSSCCRRSSSSLSAHIGPSSRPIGHDPCFGVDCAPRSKTWDAPSTHGRTQARVADGQSTAGQQGQSAAIMSGGASPISKRRSRHYAGSFGSRRSCAGWGRGGARVREQ